MLIAAETVLFRYGGGEFGLTGWGLFWLLVFMLSIGGNSTTTVVRDRFDARQARAEAEERKALLRELRKDVGK